MGMILAYQKEETCLDQIHILRKKAGVSWYTLCLFFFFIDLCSKFLMRCQVLFCFTPCVNMSVLFILYACCACRCSFGKLGKI